MEFQHSVGLRWNLPELMEEGKVLGDDHNDHNGKVLTRTATRAHHPVLYSAPPIPAGIHRNGTGIHRNRTGICRNPPEWDQ